MRTRSSLGRLGRAAAVALRLLDRAAVLVALALIRLYQLTLSPFVGRFCRFQPTCSRYAQEALRVHGFLRGGWLAARRICRCHPLGGWGFDPVPPRDGPE